MTQDEIMEMAKEAGIRFRRNVFHSGYCDGVHGDELEALIKLVAAKEREDCARVCEEIRNKYSGLGDSAERVSVEWCLEAIRARGEA